MKAINKIRNGLSVMGVAEQQLDFIFQFAPSKSNIDKDFKFRRSTMVAKQNCDKLMATETAAQPWKKMEQSSRRYDCLHQAIAHASEAAVNPRRGKRAGAKRE